MLGCIAVYFRRQVKQLNQSDVNFIVTLTSNSNPRSLLVSMSLTKFSESKIMLHIMFYRIFPTMTHSFELNQKHTRLLHISILRSNKTITRDFAHIVVKISLQSLMLETYERSWKSSDDNFKF